MSKPKPPTCALGKFAPRKMDTEEVKREGFNQHGILVVSMDDTRLSWIEKQIVEGIGKKLYGKHEQGDP